MPITTALRPLACPVPRPYLTRDFLLEPPPKTPSRAVEKLFGIQRGEGVMINYNDAQLRGGTEGGGGAGGLSGDLPEAMQEELLLDELLYALMGFAGRCCGVRWG